MPVEFLTDEEAAAYGTYQGVPSRAEMEKLFFLDAADKALIAKRRGDHNRLGFSLQLTTVRYLGLFLPDPLTVPGEVVAYLAEQLEISDPGCVRQYTERRTTKFEHADEIRAKFGLVDFEEREKELREWVDARSWTTGDGPKAIFQGAGRWLREHDVLLPRVTTLARLVAHVRGEANQRLWDTLWGLLTVEQRALLETLIRVAEGERVTQIEAVISRTELRDVVAAVTDMVAPPDADEDGEMRARLAARIVTVSGLLKVLTEVIVFGASEDGRAVLAAVKGLPKLLDGRRSRNLTVEDVDAELVRGSWRPLVFPGEGKVDKNAYVFCVLTQFHSRLKRREIYAETSTRWRDPRAQLLDGAAWAAAKDTVLTALELPEDPDELLAGHAALLDSTYRGVAGRFNENDAVSLDAEGRVHVERIKAVPDAKSLVDLRKRVEAMMPRVDLPEVILEVMGWEPSFGEAFTPVSGGRPRLRMKDLDITIAACLVSHALNIGYGPVVKKGVEALERDRIGHVDLNYLRPETYAAANAPLIRRQATIALAQAWGGGHVASVDGMRFVVAVPSLHARPSRRFFGQKRGLTWLNAINDQAAGIGAKVVSGTPRDSLHLIDVPYAQDGGQRPDIVVTDTGSYSDLVFGLVHLLGMQYRPQLADLPDQQLWRIDQGADYGALNRAARGKVDLEKIRRHWPDILRVTASIHTGSVRTYDVFRMLQRDGHPTRLGDAIASHGRIFKSLHVLTFLDDEAYRREIKVQRNLVEGRHDLGRIVFHGHKGEIYQRYHVGMEEQLGALGLVLNCIVLCYPGWRDGVCYEGRVNPRTRRGRCRGHRIRGAYVAGRDDRSRARRLPHAAVDPVRWGAHLDGAGPRPPGGRAGRGVSGVPACSAVLAEHGEVLRPRPRPMVAVP